MKKDPILNRQKPDVVEDQHPSLELPIHVDWRDQYKVTDVKDQGSCNSHWAMAVVDALESAYAIDNLDYLDDPIEFSVQ